MSEGAEADARDDGGPPVACTLTAAELADRGDAWRTVLSFATSREEVDGGIRVDFDDVPGLVGSLARLAELEAECCAWMAMSVSPHPPALTVTARGDGVAAVRGIFGG